MNNQANSTLQFTRASSSRASLSDQPTKPSCFRPTSLAFFKQASIENNMLRPLTKGNKYPASPRRKSNYGNNFVHTTRSPDSSRNEPYLMNQQTLFLRVPVLSQGYKVNPLSYFSNQIHPYPKTNLQQQEFFVKDRTSSNANYITTVLPKNDLGNCVRMEDNPYRDFSGVSPSSEDLKRYKNNTVGYDRASTPAIAPQLSKTKKGCVRNKKSTTGFVGFMGNNFPAKLHDLLSHDHSIDNIITWLPHGRSWIVHNKQEFLERVAPSHFQISKFESFTRQVNGWGFKRMTRGPDIDSYYHELFLKDMPHLIQFMKRANKSSRTRTPGQGRRKIRGESYNENLNFYKIAQTCPIPHYYSTDSRTAGTLSASSSSEKMRSSCYGIAPINVKQININTQSKVTQHDSAQGNMHCSYIPKSRASPPYHRNWIDTNDKAIYSQDVGHHSPAVLDGDVLHSLVSPSNSASPCCGSPCPQEEACDSYQCNDPPINLDLPEINLDDYFNSVPYQHDQYWYKNKDPYQDSLITDTRAPKDKHSVSISASSSSTEDEEVYLRSNSKSQPVLATKIDFTLLEEVPMKITCKHGTTSNNHNGNSAHNICGSTSMSSIEKEPIEVEDQIPYPLLHNIAPEIKCCADLTSTCTLKTDTIGALAATTAHDHTCGSHSQENMHYEHNHMNANGSQLNSSSPSDSESNSDIFQYDSTLAGARIDTDLDMSVGMDMDLNLDLNLDDPMFVFPSNLW